MLFLASAAWKGHEMPGWNYVARASRRELQQMERCWQWQAAYMRANANERGERAEQDSGARA